MNECKSKNVLISSMSQDWVGIDLDGTVLGQNGSGQNCSDKMVWTKWYTDKMSLDKMVWTKWYGQNGTNKTVLIKSSTNLSIPFPLTICFFHQTRFHLDPFTFPLCA